MFLPCVPIQETIYNKHLKTKECIVNLKSKSAIARKKQQMIEYLGGAPELVILNNNQVLHLNKYGDQAVQNLA